MGLWVQKGVKEMVGLCSGFEDLIPWPGGKRTLLLVKWWAEGMVKMIAQEEGTAWY